MAPPRAREARRTAAARRGPEAQSRGLAGLLCAGAVLCSFGPTWRTFVSIGGSHTSARSRSAGLARRAADMDLDDVTLLPMEDEISLDEFEMAPMPEVKPPARRLQGFVQDGLPATADPGLDTTKQLASPISSLDDAASKILSNSDSEDDDGKKKKGRGKRKKRWLMGRGSAKRRKLEENQKLQDWLIENKVWVSDKSDWGRHSSGVSMAVETREQAENEVSGRGLVARRDIDIYEELARVPLDVILTKETARKKWGKEIIPDTMSEYAAIALMLVSEKFKETNSFWLPYLNILPSVDDVGASVFWPQTELDQLLEGSPLRNMSMFLRRRLSDEFSGLEERLFDTDPDEFPREAFTLENYEWAYSCLFSRSVRLNFKDEVEEGKEDFVALVPFIDLINHNPTSTTYIEGMKEGVELPFGMSRKDKYIMVRADKYYQQYEQIYISYGPKSNAQLLMLYGFALERNPADFVEVLVKYLLDESPMAAAKRRFLKKKGVGRDAYPLYRDRFTNEMMQFMRLLVLVPEDLRLSDDSEEAIDDALEFLPFSRAFGELPERRALERLRALCVELLDGYPTTADQDEDVISDRSVFELLPKNQRMALRVRYGEKMVLQNTMTTIDRTMNNLGQLTEIEKENEEERANAKNTFLGRLGLKVDPAFKATNLEELMQELDI